MATQARQLSFDDVQAGQSAAPATAVPRSRRPRSAHQENLERVRNIVADTVLAFCRARIGKDFHGEELRRHVAAAHPTAPASADRILRDLRQRGALQYELVSRRDSLYRVWTVRE